MAGCSHGPGISGEFRISYVWADGKLQTAVVETVKPQGPISQAARSVIVETVQPYIAEGTRAAGLKRASGDIRVIIYGPPPYFVQVGGFEITEPNFSALYAAVEMEDTQEIRRVVSTYNNVNQRELPSRRTALAIAAAGGHVKSLRTLLELGSDPNPSDYIGVTPLMDAGEAGNEECVRALILAGAKTDSVDEARDSASSFAKRLHRNRMLPLLVSR